MKVHVTRPVPESALELLRDQGFEVTVPDDPGLPEREALLSAVEGCHGVLALLTETIDAELMDRAPDLKVVANMAVGYDNIDVPAAKERGVVVCNTPGVLTESTADFAWALLLAAARRVHEGDQMVRRGQWKWWGPMMLLGRDLFGKTLGIVGMGRIGRAVARRAGGFGMKVLYHSRSEKPDLEAEHVGLEELLRRSDFVSLHTPLTPETHHLLGAEELALMKPEAILVNTSRGPVVDEEALAKALAGGRLGGAGLDVFEREPEVHPALLGEPRAVLAPHAASATVETRTLMAEMAAQGIIDVLEGRAPKHQV